MLITLNKLHAHPSNANRMSRAHYQQLVQRIRQTRRYPRLIVRPHPSIHDAWQVLDGHHRLAALKDIGETAAYCDVWSDIDDEHATILLLTLNRLRGNDDPKRRGELLSALCEAVGEQRLPGLVPETPARLKRLLSVAATPPTPVRPAMITPTREPVTFFMTSAQRSRLDEHLGGRTPDRAAELLTLVERGISREPNGA